MYHQCCWHRCQICCCFHAEVCDHRCVVDTGGKFTTSVKDDGGKFATSVKDAGGKFATSAVYLEFWISLLIFKIKQNSSKGTSKVSLKLMGGLFYWGPVRFFPTWSKNPSWKNSSSPFRKNLFNPSTVFSSKRQAGMKTIFYYFYFITLYKVRKSQLT